MSETATFICSICGEPSTDICVYCTKDACPNHRCTKCYRCSDCCECDLSGYRHLSSNAAWKGRAENESEQVPGDQRREQNVHSAQQEQFPAAPAIDSQNQG